MPDDDLVRLADSSLLIDPGPDEQGHDEIAAGWGGTMRDGLAVRAERGGVEIAITGAIVIDPMLGIRRCAIGITDGRIVAIGKAGNPDTMDGVEVVLDTATAVFDARGWIATPGGIDTHVHLLSPQVVDAALAGGITSLVIQDFGPVWNLGSNPPEAMAATWGSFEAHPVNVALLVRGSSARPGPVERALAAGGAGLKIHEDVGAGVPQIRCALDVAERHDVQLAIHTDGLNESAGLADTLAAIDGRTIHAFHIEGAGGGHAPNVFELAGRSHVLTSSTTPTVPYGVSTVAEHRAMVAAVHVLEPGRRHGDSAILNHRVRRATMAAEPVLHDLGVIHMMSSDSQGMGRIGEITSRTFQCASAMREERGGEGGRHDNERVLRYLAKLTINPAIAHGMARHVGSLELGKLADVVFWRPDMFAVRPELVLKAGLPVWGASGSGNASTAMTEPVSVQRQVAAYGTAPGRVSLAFLAGSALAADLPITRPRARVEGCRGLTAADMVRNTRTGVVRVDAVRDVVTLDGEVVAAEPVSRVAFSGTYLLG